MQNNDLPCQKDIILDGTIHRYGKNGGSDSQDEWYIGYQKDSFIYCTYGSWSSDEKFTFRSGNVDPEHLKALQQEIEEYRRLAYQEILKVRDEAKNKSTAIIQDSQLSQTHPYKDKKKIKHDVLVNKNYIIVPLQNIDGEIESLISISPNGEKKNLKGGKIKGNFHLIGELEDPQKIYLAEGFATAHAIYEATTCTTLACGSVNNLIPVSTQLKAKFPNAKLMLCQDIGTPADKISKEWQEKFQGTILKPESEVNGYDFNDLLVEKGLDKLQDALRCKSFPVLYVRDLIEKDVPEPEWLIPGQIVTQSCTLIHARGGIGKSRLLVDLALGLAERNIHDETGEEFPKEKCSSRFMWWKIPKTHRVLYIDTELFIYEVQKRVKDSIIRRKSRFKESDLAFILKQDMDDSFNLYNEETKNKLEMLFDDFDVIIIDNLQNALVDDDLQGESKENQAKYWFLFSSWLKKWQKRGKTFFLAHHTGKSGEYRGTSRIEGDVDNIIHLSHPDKHKIRINEEVDLAFVYETEKGRNIKFSDRKPFLATLGQNPKFVGGWELAYIDTKEK